MEKTEVHEKNVTMKGKLVVPLDHPRTFDYQNVSANAAAAASGALYTPLSGKDVYIKQWLVSELSGNAGVIWLQDNSGHICPPIPVQANTVVSWDPRPAACGPTHGTIYWETGAAFNGEMTLIVQVDPQRIE